MSLAKTVSQIAPGDHACAVVDSDEEHWEIAADYVRDGLARREKIVYFDGERTASPLLRRLREVGADVDQLRRSGQLVVMPPEIMHGFWDRSPDEVCGLLRESVAAGLAEGYAAVRLTDEPGSGGPPEARGLGELDRMIHEVVTGQPVTVLCQYERRFWSPEELDDLDELHPVRVVSPALYDDGLVRVTRLTAGTRICGEIDYSNREAVRVVIEAELERPPSAAHDGAVVLHLESLRFADVTSAAHLVRSADALPPERRLRLLGPQPPVVRMLQRCGADFSARLTVVAGDPSDGDATRPRHPTRPRHTEPG